MKERSPVHFVAGLFQPVTPFPQRMRRQTERGGIFRKPHAAPVHRLHMHAPERLKSNRTGVRAHAVAIARRSCPRLQLPLLCAALSAFSGENFADVLHAYATLPCSADGAPTASNLSSRDRAAGSSAPLRARCDTRRQRGSTAAPAVKRQSRRRLAQWKVEVTNEKPWRIADLLADLT